MRFYRVILMLLLTVFLADTVSAAVSLHLPAAPPGGMHDMQQHEYDHMQQGDQDEAQHVEKCQSCHDCLSCFSMLPLALKAVTSSLHGDRIATANTPIYFPPALARLQRPPIQLSV